jgi:asparagine synthase (glutamine-hydrolysing)
MCGIAGIYSYHADAQQFDHDDLFRMRDYMVSRGPDGCGAWFSRDERIGLAHRRLSIIDLTECGAQPMQNGDGSLVVTFNGEIYNYSQLRDELEQMGHCFRSTSDTEVLLHLYEDKGADMLRDLRGMFAFAIWDEKKQGLFIARDPFGIKPLYLADNGRTLRFASQVKALLAGGAVDTSLDPAGHVGFFLWGHIPDPYTLYKGIRALPAGSYAWVQKSERQSSVTIHQYCSIPEELRAAAEQPLILQGGELHAYLREAMLDTVRHHLVADVPVGVFLSSGLDSTTLVALATELVGNGLHTVTLGFREYENTSYNEVPLAEQVARQYGTNHQSIMVEQRNFRDDFERMLEVMDQPTTDGVNSYFVSKAAAQTGLKVAISGLGGDELFGSYPSFTQIPRLVRNISPFNAIPGLGRGFRVISAPLLKRFTSPKYASLFEYGGDTYGAYLLRRGMFMPWELPELLDGEMVREGWAELKTLLHLQETGNMVDGDHLKISALEMCWYMRNQILRDSDWASMAHSLEIRVPLVDLQLLRKVAPLFAGKHCIDKRDMAATPLHKLPVEVTGRPKTGFSVPVRDWLTGTGGRGLRGWARELYTIFSGVK